MAAPGTSPQPSSTAGTGAVEEGELAGALELAVDRGIVAPSSEASRDARDLQRTVRRAIWEGAVLDAPFILSNLAATVIASAGLISDSAATVIGAMLVATLMGPIMGVGLALVEFDNRLLRRALFALSTGGAMVLAVGVLSGLVAPRADATSEMMSRTSPRFADLIVAFASGAVCAYAATVARLSAAIVGVAIAVALVPPLATAGLFIARAEWTPATGALLLTFVNMVAIQLSTSIVFWLRGFRGRRAAESSGRAQLRQQAVSLLLLVALALTLWFHGIRLVHQKRFESAVQQAIESALLSRPGARLNEVTFAKQDGRSVATAVVRSPTRFTQADVNAMAERLPRAPDGSAVQLTLRHVAIEVLSDAR